MIDAAEGRMAIGTVTSYLVGLGVTHWLQGGALLGLTRSGEFIPHDVDLDFGVPWTVDLEELAYRLHRDLNFTPVLIAGSRELGGQLSMLTPKGLRVDFFGMLPPEATGICRFAVWMGGYQRTLLEVSAFEPRPGSAKGISLMFVPSHVQRYLEELYGKDWRTPDPTWCPMTSPAFVRNTHFDPPIARLFIKEDES